MGVKRLGGAGVAMRDGLIELCLPVTDGIMELRLPVTVTEDLLVEGAPSPPPDACTGDNRPLAQANSTIGKLKNARFNSLQMNSITGSE